MSNIKDRINRIKEPGYFKEMQVVTVDDEQLIYVVVQFPYKWIIDDEIGEKFNVTYQAGQSRGEFYFCADMENGFDCVFDAIDYNIEKMLAAEERASLLTIKVRELKELFEDESVSLEALRTLEFTFSENTRKKRGPKPSQKKEEENKNNNETNNTED